MFSSATYARREGDQLELLVSAALGHFRNGMTRFQYPTELRGITAAQAWYPHRKAIGKLNSSILKAIDNGAGVYAIFSAEPTHMFELKYIGQANADGMRQRVRSHLVWRNKETSSGRYTGSVFDQVMSEVSIGNEIAFSFTGISPESLRHYVEDSLLCKFHPEWNTHNTNAQARIGARDFCKWYIPEHLRTAA